MPKSQSPTESTDFQQEPLVQAQPRLCKDAQLPVQACSHKISIACLLPMLCARTLLPLFLLRDKHLMH